MQIRIRDSGKVMYESEFRALHPNTSMPQQLSEALLNSMGADVVFEGPQASPTRYQVAFADGVQQTNGKWFTKWSVKDMDAEAIAAKDAEQAKNVRKQRDDKLAECDWTQVDDAPVDKAVWATYRTALRNVPAQTGFPWTVEWPDAP
jgi:hypothetical protein